MIHPGADLSPNPFSEALPLQPRIWDNSLFQQFIHCPRHFWYATIQGLRHKPAADGLAPIDLTFGSLIHDGVDIFTKTRAAGATTQEAAAAALAYVLESSWLAGEPADVFGGRYGYVWQCDDRTRTVTAKGIKRCPWSYKEHLGQPEACEACGRGVTTRFTYLCPEKVKNRRTLCRSLIALCDHLTASSVTPKVFSDGRIGSEYRWFRELSIPSPDGTPYLMTGSFDGVAEAPGVSTLAPEYKTTRRNPDDSYFASLSMSPQVYTYSWALDGEFGSSSRVMLCVIHVTTGSTEIHPKIVYLNPEQLAEWQMELEHYVQEAQLRAQLAYQHEAEGRDPALAYPRRLSACNSLPGAPTTPCPFRDFCTLAPSDRAQFISSNFVVDRWSPIAVKGVLPHAQRKDVLEVPGEEAGV